MHTSRVSSPRYSASRVFFCLETASHYSSPTRLTRLLPQLIFHCATVFYAPRRHSRLLARRPHSPTTLDSPRARLAASCASLARVLSAIGTTAGRVPVVVEHTRQPIQPALHRSREFSSIVSVSRERFCLERSRSSRNASLHSSYLACPECGPRIKSCGRERARAAVVLDSDFDGLRLSRRQLLKGRTHSHASGINRWYEQKPRMRRRFEHDGHGPGVLVVFETIKLG
jgi:hypothetical protein